MAKIAANPNSDDLSEPGVASRFRGSQLAKHIEQIGMVKPGKFLLGQKVIYNAGEGLTSIKIKVRTGN